MIHLSFVFSFMAVAFSSVRPQSDNTTVNPLRTPIAANLTAPSALRAPNPDPITHTAQPFSPFPNSFSSHLFSTSSSLITTPNTLPPLYLRISAHPRLFGTFAQGARMVVAHHVRGYPAQSRWPLLTISKLKRWSINYYIDTAKTAERASSDHTSSTAAAATTPRVSSEASSPTTTNQPSPRTPSRHGCRAQRFPTGCGISSIDGRQPLNAAASLTRNRCARQLPSRMRSAKDESKCEPQGVMPASMTE